MDENCLVCCQIAKLRVRALPKRLIVNLTASDSSHVGDISRIKLRPNGEKLLGQHYYVRGVTQFNP
jgi:hypothetical protein